ncbi:hypothetical protein [Streptomyces sp. NPDC093071]
MVPARTSVAAAVVVVVMVVRFVLDPRGSYGAPGVRGGGER